MTGRRSVNIYDYPEHLNPFFEDDNHTKLRFWTSTKKKPRSNSFSFQSIKDFKQSLFSRAATRKRSAASSSSLSHLSCYHTPDKNDEPPQNDDEKRKSFIYPTLRKLGRTFSIRSKSKKRDTSADRRSPSPAENEATYSYSHRQTMPADTHVYRAPVTPLPRIRFHERVRNVEPEEATSPVDDTNPFKDEDDLKTPSTSSKPTTPPRKKKRAPPPPPLRQSSLTRKSLSAEFSLHGREFEDNTTNEIEHKDTERTEIEHKDTERTEIEDTKVETKIEVTKVETKIEVTKVERKTDSEKEATKVETETDSEKEATKSETCSSQENMPTKEEDTASETEPFQINYNTELNISSSEISVCSETRLEQQQQQNAVEDSSDLLELVQKLQLEVEKLTDDTNNNVIASTFNASKKANFYGYDDDSASNTKTEVDNHLDGEDDDNDVVIGAPLSPRLVRLKKDNEWIKH